MSSSCRPIHLPAFDLSSLVIARQSLHRFLHAKAIGLGVCDVRNRYQCLNPALATINGAAIEDHLNNTIHDIIGEVALAVEPLLLKVKDTGSPVCVRIAGQLPNATEPAEWITCHVPLVRPGHRKILGCGSAVVNVTPLARMESTLAGVMARQDRRLDPDAVRFVQSLQHCLDDYSAALTSTMTSVVRKAWQADQADTAQLAPAIQSMDDRVIEMRKLIASVEGSFRACVPSLN
ncbi:hypothetical protein [Silvibacterium acidisoli]|uniref:hypothetical protein n=1 Tax=Acidobacteriaceae bacterium ZG23-2 TaxID=2883246 RepID=UPI00406C34F9